MPDLLDGQTAEMQGSGKNPYILKNVGGVYSCSCPAWRNQSTPIDLRTCKHLKKLRGEAAELARIGGYSSHKEDSLQSASGDSLHKSGLPNLIEEEKEEKTPVLLAHHWDTVQDLTGWWMSEKFDGVRAFWTGEQFVSRAGNKFHAPQWFTAGLPKFPVDGELWIGRKRFDETSGLVRQHNGGDKWKQLRYLVFDVPTQKGLFEARVEFINWMCKDIEYAIPVEHKLCKGIDHLKSELKAIEALGGEGLMGRMPGSLYEVGKSNTLLKVKSFYDAEAVVVSYEPGKGKHKGKMGAMWCRLPSGVDFKIGTGFDDAVRANPPPIGCQITFRYTEVLKSGKPRFASFIRIRPEE